MKQLVGYPPLEPVGPKQERINARYRFRVALFVRRGMDEYEAGHMGHLLENRDAEKDDRRVCLECKNLQRPGTCAAAEQGRIKPLAKHTKYEPVRDILHRCDAFEFLTP
jgi:hypothetical protein